MWLTATMLDNIGLDRSTIHLPVYIPIHALSSHHSHVHRRTVTSYGAVHSFHFVAANIKALSEAWFHTSEGTRDPGSWFPTSNS